MENIRIIVMPVSEFDRKDAELLEATKGVLPPKLTELYELGASIYTLRDFMDLVNDEEFNADACWITYVELETI